MRLIASSLVLLSLGFALPVAAADAAKVSFQSSLVTSYDAAAQKILQLAGAFTDEQLAWRPAEGVRSTRDVILHVAGANFYLGSQLGAKPPEGIDPQKIEGFKGSRTEVIALLEKSSDFVKNAVQAVPDADLGKDVRFFGQTASEMRFMLIIVEHGHEHLGQLIAYARSNGVTPPWTQ